MTTHAILIQDAVMAKDVDSLNRFAEAAFDVDNGNVVQLLTKSATAGEGEVWTATKPASASLANLYMVAEPEVVIITAADGTEYKGINADPRNFFTAAGKTFTAFKLQYGDIVTLTADAFANSIASNTFANPSNATALLTWGASATASSTAFKLVGTTYVSVGSGTLGATQRVVAYQLQCIQVA